MPKPFRVQETPARNTNEEKPATAPLPGSAIVNSEKTGEYLPTGDKDTARMPEIPWPPAHATTGDHKPYKNVSQK
jgi:hypothetical protein